MGRRRFWAALVLGLAGLAVLLNLGFWQVDRLAWKNGIVETIEARIHAEPASFAEIAAMAEEGGDVDYRPVRVAGRFLHEAERYFLATSEGEAGWNVYTPLLIEGRGEAVFVNRGFVPYARRDPATREAGQEEGPAEVVGLARDAPAEKPAPILPDNDPAGNNFYWRSLAGMAEGVALPAGVRLVPFFVDAGPGAPPGGLPVGGATVIDIRNNHLEYAVTWFSLAAILAAMLLALVVAQARRRA